MARPIPHLILVLMCVPLPAAAADGSLRPLQSLGTPGDCYNDGIAVRADARPASLTHADFDGDGVADIVCGYAVGSDGVVTVGRSSIGTPSDLLDVPIVPEFLLAGDLDADGAWDLITGEHGKQSLWLLRGDGRGEFEAAERFDLDGRVTTLTAADIDRVDGLADLVVGIDGARGPAIVVFRGPEGALRAAAERLPLPRAAAGLLSGLFDDDTLVDLAVDLDGEMLLLTGRDRLLRAERIVAPADAEALGKIETRRRKQDWPEAMPGRNLVAMPMRLNADAVPDHVIFLDGDLVPRVSMSAPVATFTVTNANDNGSGSLRRAISDANNQPGADLIRFNIPGTGPFEIVLESPLPAIASAVTIDGFTQPGASPNSAPAPGALNTVLQIILDGDLAGLDTDGLQLVVPSNVIRGLNIRDFDGGGVKIMSDANIVEGCFIGVDDPGTDTDGNSADGILIDGGSANLIGGTAPAARNLISANGDDGIDIRNPVSMDNQVLGNLLGTDVSGALSLGNSSDGIQIESAFNTRIGGTAAGSGNVISGNDGDGIDLSDGPGTLVQGNLVGLAPDGLSTVPNDTGILVNGEGVTVGGTAPGSGNVVSGNDDIGVAILSSDTVGAVVQGNLIGTDASGTVARGNGSSGVALEDASSALIGGVAAGAANVISANDAAGVRIQFPEATGNEVQGNFIGTDITGTAALGNATDGLILINAPSNLIGGTEPGAGNLLSGNVRYGVYLVSVQSSLNSVQGNLIGTDISGTVALGNGSAGVLFGFDASDNLIGGAAPGAGNVISGNAGPGVFFLNADGSDNRVQGNWIGTDPTGTAILGNGGAGVSVLGGSGHSIGGVGPGEGNTITDNGAEGVVVAGTPTPAMRIRILGNAIHANASLGIDLDGDGISPNDVGDSDLDGGNQLQNFPVLNAAALDIANLVTVDGSLNSEPDQAYRLEFFSSEACDGSGHGEGRHFLGSEDVATDGSGNATFSVALPNHSLDADVVTATATDPIGNTSEFAACVASACADMSVFGEALLAADKTTLTWSTPSVVRVVRGELSLVGTYAVFQVDLLPAATSVDLSTDSPGPGAGVYYVVKYLVCGSWQTESAAEPDRDMLLP